MKAYTDETVKALQQFFVDVVGVEPQTREVDSTSLLIFSQGENVIFEVKVIPLLEPLIRMTVHRPAYQNTREAFFSRSEVCGTVYTEDNLQQILEVFRPKVQRMLSLDLAERIGL